MKFAEKCEREGELLSYSPGKSDIMTDLDEPEGAGVSGLAMGLVRGGRHNRIRALLDRFYMLNAELSELMRAGLPLNDGTDEYPRKLGDHIRAFDRLLGDDEGKGGAIPSTAREVLIEYGLFLSSLDKRARRAFQDFEAEFTGEFKIGDTGRVIRDWYDEKAPDIDADRLEVGTMLTICCVGIGWQFAAVQ
jgi:hypothetical protein